MVGWLTMFEKPWPTNGVEGCHFYHALDLPGIGAVAGDWDLRGRFEEYVGRVDLHGKRVLDVGTASGFLTWETEKRGAEVVSFDLDGAHRQYLLPFKDSIYCRDRTESIRQRNEYFNAMKRSYWLAHRLLGSRAQVYYGDVENLPPALGRFDVAFVCSILEHLRDQIAPLESIARLVSERLVLTGPILETEEPIAMFAGDPERAEANYSFWSYSIGTYRHILKMLGFEIEAVTSGTYRCVLFGSEPEIQTIIAVRVGIPAYAAVIVSDDIPKVMTTGQTYTVHVVIQNTGANAWTAAQGYKLGFVGDHPPFGPARVLIDPTVSVGSWQQHTFTFTLTPRSSGTFTLGYEMVQEGVIWFGGTLTVTVSVA